MATTSMTRCNTCGEDKFVIVKVGNGSRGKDECSECYHKRIKAEINAVKV